MTSLASTSSAWPFPTDAKTYCRVLDLAPKGEALLLMQRRRELRARKTRRTHTSPMRSTNNSESNDEDKRRVGCKAAINQIVD